VIYLDAYYYTNQEISLCTRKNLFLPATSEHPQRFPLFEFNKNEREAATTLIFVLGEEGRRKINFPP
jgi:hypothetical protein